MKKFLVKDWIVTLLSIPILLLCSFAYYLPGGGALCPLHTPHPIGVTTRGHSKADDVVFV